MMEKHFVRFISPGTFFAETSEKEIKSWNVPAAVEMARNVTERHGAKPYAFQFFTRTRGPNDLDSKIAKTSHNYFLGGRIETYDEVCARNDPKEEILRSNMRNNNIKRVLVNTNSYKSVLPLEENDVVIDVKL